MARGNRKDIVDPFKVRVYHCISRVVRQARLLGVDPNSGKNYDHRKQWIEDLTRDLAKYFGIDVIALAIMINHIHHQLRSRPDIVKTWSDLEVARRWLHICPGSRKKKKKKLGKKRNQDAEGDSESPPDNGPTEEEIQALSKDRKRIKEIRKRLSDISWFMRQLKQQIAKRANAEDGVTGHFWAARFKCIRLYSEAACLACCVYIDLNMTRAGTATCPEDSFNTSIYMRIIGFQSRRHKYRRKRGEKEPDSYDPQYDAFLAPIYKLEPAMAGKFAELGLRVSDEPFFDIDFNQYVELVDKTGRQIVSGKQSISAELPPILDRLGISRNCWADKINDFGNWTRRVVGTPAEMKQAAAEAGQQWYQGVSHCRELFIDSQPPDPD